MNRHQLCMKNKQKKQQQSSQEALHNLNTFGTFCESLVKLNTKAVHFCLIEN